MLKAFAIGGLICLVGQILIDLTKLTPGRILVAFVVTGVTQTGTFTKKFATFVDENREKLAAACEKLGGILQPRMAGADLTCRFPVTPFFPVLLQFWESDEEFPAKLLLLWDRNADSFLHFETTFYLQGDLLERLKREMESQ